MNRIKEARFIRKMTQMRLFQLTGIWPSKISSVENGYVTPTELEKDKLAKVLELQKEWLFP